MAGAGIIKAEYDDSEFKTILDALSKASMPDLLAIAHAAGEELDYISNKAFEHEKDPVTEKNWEPLKRQRPNGKKMLDLGGQLRRSMNWEAFPDGSVIYGSNVIYARIHQKGGQTGKNQKSSIPARPYMGVTKDFDRKFLNDPEILKLLGLGE